MFARTEFIDHFYQFATESDWQTGVELYQAGNLIDLSMVESLIVSRVDDVEPAEVRIKMHANRRFIQWLECTCAKNRNRGAFCQHIVATVFHLDREDPQLVQQLDLKMLVRPPSQNRRRVFAEPPTATKSVLAHLRGSISEIKPQDDGRILVNVEIKRGVITSYDLTIDQAAEFVATAQVDSPYLLREQTLQPSIYVKKDGREAVLWRKVLVISSGLGKLQSTVSLSKAVVYRRATNDDPQEIYFIDYEKHRNFLGDRYLFLSGYGYLAIDKDDHWRALADGKRCSGDQAAMLIASGFEELTSCKNLFIDHALHNEVVVDDLKLAEVEVKEAEGNRFRLSLNYRFGDKKVSLVKLLGRGKKRKYLKADNNNWLRIPELMADGDWQVDGDGEHLIASPLDVHRLKAALGDYDTFVGSKELLAKLTSKTNFDEMIEPPPLDHSNLNLRAYQHFGFKWLWWLYQNNLHGLLADEMGLGKTHQTMALLSAIQRQNTDFRFMVICPTTVLNHWADKVEEFAPQLNPTIYHGQGRTSQLPKLGGKQITTITSYGVLQRDINELQKHYWDVVVLDEAHYVKNSSTYTYRAACKLSNKMRICLSGTPFENDLRELKSIFDFLLPGYLGSDRFFRKHILRPLKTSNSLGDDLILKRLIHPFKLRRTKEVVLPDLPDKIIDIRSCTLAPDQRRLYQSIVEVRARPLSQQLAREAGMPTVHIFAVLNLLKQVCNHPLLLMDGLDIDQHESGKFELLKELIFEGMASEQKIVIYTQYLKMVDIIASYLSQQRIKYVTLTGASQKRGKLIAQFQNDKATKVFVATLLTGGIGIDLTAASIVIHYDRWWNASKENQATDRVHRIGQHKNVQVFKLLTKDTFEEKIDLLIRKKQDLFEKYLEKDEEIFKNLTRQELIGLLQ